ncbi:MAG: hypothetical protein B6244_06635 [Candidatus Cloacimonetes bacterium 4572_55]|nr:MAG: hypothetical protein B6244_06635 [Candidatus Cloacimonetes bacterium 4572_55]
MVRFKRYEVNQVELQWGEKRLAAQKEGTSSWRVQEPVPSEIPRVDMDVVLNQILDLTAISPVQPHTLPTDDQIWGLFVLKTKKETIRFSLYQFDDDRVIGKVETSYYLLEPSLIEMLEKSLNTLDRRVSNPDS